MFKSSQTCLVSGRGLFVINYNGTVYVLVFSPSDRAQQTTERSGPCQPHLGYATDTYIFVGSEIA